MAINHRPDIHQQVICANVFIRKDGKYLVLRRSPLKKYAPVFGVRSQGLTSMFGNALLAYILVKDGRAIGTWRRALRGKNMDMQVSPRRALSAKDQDLLGQAAETYASFMGLRLSSLRITPA